MATFEIIIESSFLPARTLAGFYNSDDDELKMAQKIAAMINNDQALKTSGISATARARYVRLFWTGPAPAKLPIAVRSDNREIRMRQVSRKPTPTGSCITYQVFKGCLHCNLFLWTDDNYCLICANEAMYAAQQSRESRMRRRYY